MKTPERVGKYELEKYLGGGMASVFRARDTLIGRTVAVKILKESLHPDDAAHQRFILEARVAGNLNHEHVIRTYDFGFDAAGHPYMVMEFLEGEDLSQAIKGGRTGDFHNRLRIARELASALEYIHPRNVIHRDLKPENVFLADEGKVKLMDFGIARTENTGLTQAGTAIGTPAYMAPEQILAKPVTKLVDVYSYGVLLYELFTGEKAFQGENMERIFHQIFTQKLDGGKLSAAGVPRGLADLIVRCTDREPTARPQDFGEIRMALEGAAMAPAAAVGAPPRALTADAETRVYPAPVRPVTGEVPVRGGLPGWWKGAAVGVGIAVVAALALLMFLPRDKSVRGVKELPKRISSPAGEMVLVPEGQFLFGESKQAISLPAYYIDRTEVTNRAYAEFARATGKALPEGFAADKPDLPVVNVTFEEAAAFARWADKALPTSRQWERAARGDSGRTYPWGEEADGSRAHVGAGRDGRLAAAIGYESGASPYGALQMVGNAWELVDEPGQPSAQALESFGRLLTPPPGEGERWVLIRGGSFAEPLDSKVMWDSVTVPARYRGALVGFRCVRAAER